MVDALARHPGGAAGVGFGSWLLSVMDVLDPILQFILLAGSTIVVILTVIIKLREVRKGG